MIKITEIGFCSLLFPFTIHRVRNMSNRPSRIIGAIVFFSFLFFSTVHAQDSLITRLTFIHWNDFHAANLPYEVRPAKHKTGPTYLVGGSAVLKAYIDSLRKVHRNPTVIFAGDDFQGSPISSFTRGQSQMDLMTRIGPDVLTIGNHEFDYGAAHFRAMARQTPLQYLVSNLYYQDGDSLFFPAYQIREMDGIRIALIGVTTDELMRLSLPVNVTGLRVEPAASAVRKTMDSILVRFGKPDLWVLISHCGLEGDTSIARQIPELNLIIGAHTHNALFREVVIGQTRIVQAGARGRYVGEVLMDYHKKNKSILRFQYKLIETSSRTIKPDTAIAAMVDRFEQMIGQELDQVIGELKVDWKIPRDYYESNLGNFEADVFREYAGADIAFMNNGGLRKELPAGPIRIRDIWEINPFNNTLVTITVKGSVIPSMIHYSLHHAESFVQVSGLSYKAKRLGAKKFEIIEIKVGGKSIDPEKNYKIVMNNYMGSHLDAIFGLSAEKYPVTDLGIADRDVLISAIRERKIIAQEIDGRVQFID